MKYYKSICIECNEKLTLKVYEYSIEHYNQPLCINCQYSLNDVLNNTTATEESINLYFELKKRGVPAIIEKNDGYKTIDIAVPEAKVNIEVDGKHHQVNADQALTDLKRIVHSFKKGYTTLRIPNALVRSYLEETTELITEYLIISNSRRN